MDGVTYCKVTLHYPCVVTPPVAAEWRLYVVRADDLAMYGTDVSMAAGPLRRGTVIGIAGDDGHWFASASNSAPQGKAGEGWVEAPLAVAHDTAAAMLIVGRIPRSAMPNLSMLGMIRVNSDEHCETTTRIGQLIDWIVEEDLRKEAGSAEVVQRLSEIITVELARVARARSVLFSERTGGTDYDPRIWRTIAAISRDPQHAWTLFELAETAGMSRSAFATRYQQVVGMTPMRSLRRLRMHRAAVALAHSATQTLAPLAAAAGYGSDAAFCRAYAKEFGHPPKHPGRLIL